MRSIGDTCVIAGNNVYAGNLDNVTRGIDKKLTNACVVRMNDCGTVSKTMEVARTFLNYKGASVVVAGEAVEGQGAQLADLAVGVGARYIRCGGMLRADHVAGWSRLLSVARELEALGLLGPQPTLPPCELPPPPTEPVVDVSTKPEKKKK